jgi:hypothetical protein
VVEVVFVAVVTMSGDFGTTFVYCFVDCGVSFVFRVSIY